MVPDPMDQGTGKGFHIKMGLIQLSTKTAYLPGLKWHE